MQRDLYFQEYFSSKSTSTVYGKPYKIGETIQQRTTRTEKQFFFITSLNTCVVTELDNNFKSTQ